jgi:hypothetical protein
MNHLFAKQLDLRSMETEDTETENLEFLEQFQQRKLQSELISDTPDNDDFAKLFKILIAKTSGEEAAELFQKHFCNR